MKIYLIRHGKTEANELRLYCGASDVPLSEAGKRELRELKNRIKYPDASRCRVLTSGMLRAEQTLKILFGDIPHEAEAGFREMDFGDFELRGWNELQFDADYLAWLSGDNEKNRCPRGESGEEMTARVLDTYYNSISSGKDTLIVAHGGTIAAIMAALFPRENRNRYEWQPEAGRGWAIEAGGWHEI